MLKENLPHYFKKKIIFLLKNNFHKKSCQISFMNSKILIKQTKSPCHNHNHQYHFKNYFSAYFSGWLASFFNSNGNYT